MTKFEESIAERRVSMEGKSLKLSADVTISPKQSYKGLYKKKQKTDVLQKLKK